MGSDLVMMNVIAAVAGMAVLVLTTIQTYQSDPERRVGRGLGAGKPDRAHQALTYVGILLLTASAAMLQRDIGWWSWAAVYVPVYLAQWVVRKVYCRPGQAPLGPYVDLARTEVHG